MMTLSHLMYYTCQRLLGPLLIHLYYLLQLKASHQYIYLPLIKVPHYHLQNLLLLLEFIVLAMEENLLVIKIKFYLQNNQHVNFVSTNMLTPGILQTNVHINIQPT
jgi:hypothetical protein